MASGTPLYGDRSPTIGQYVVIAGSALLDNERVLTGTSNQIVITDNGAGSTVVLSTPQNIHTAATPTFADVFVPDGGSFGISGNELLTFNAAGTAVFSGCKVGIGGVPTSILEIDGMGLSKALSLQLHGATYSSIYFMNDSVDVSARNWAIIAPLTAFGTIEFRVGDAQGDDPQSSGSTKLTINKDGNITVTGTVDGIDIAGAAAAEYVCISGDANIANERILTGTSNQIVVTDNGAGSTVVLSTPQDIHTSATPTFGGIIIADGGTIGQAAGPLLTFDDSNNYLEITGCKVGIGTTTPLELFEVRSAGFTELAISSNRNISGQGIGAWRFYGRNDAGTPEDIVYVSINAKMDDTSDGSEDGSLQFWTVKAGNITQQVTIEYTGYVGMGITSGMLGKLHIDQFSSTGAKPVLFLDQGDVSEQCIQFSSDGVDRDINLFTVDVTGVPKLYWDESEDKFVLTKGLVETGDLEFAGDGAGLVFGEIYANDVTDEIAIAIAGQANKVQITSFSVDGLANNMTVSHANDDITVLVAGMYFCSVSVTLSSAGGGGADDIGFAVYKLNGTSEFANLHGHRKLAGGGGDRGSATMSGIVDLAVNDTIEIWVWNEDSTDNVVVDDITLSLIMIGGT